MIIINLSCLPLNELPCPSLSLRKKAVSKASSSDGAGSDRADMEQFKQVSSGHFTAQREAYWYASVFPYCMGD